MQGDDSRDDLRADELPSDDLPSDELRVEDLDDPQTAPSRSLALMRRLYRAWKRPRSPQGRLLAARVTAVGLTLALALALVAIVGDHPPAAQDHVVPGAAPMPITASEAVPLVTLPGQAPSPVSGSGWERITLPPVPWGIVNTMAVSPSDPSTIYACIRAASGDPTLDPALLPAVAWRTRDAGQHWSSMPLPPIKAQWCDLELAAEGSARLMLSIPADQGTRVFVSSDGGDSWMRVKIPPFGQTATPIVGQMPSPSALCVPWATAHHLYCCCSYVESTGVATTYYPDGSSVTSSSAQFAQALWRSYDDGRTWQRTSMGITTGPNDMLSVIQMRDENHLLARVYRQGEQDPREEIWETRDAGTSWHLAQSNSQLYTDPILSPGGRASAADRAPDYVAVNDQGPIDLFDLGVRQRDETGAWRTLPPLPVPGASPDRTGLVQVFDETNDGRLLAFGVDPHTGVPPAATVPAYSSTTLPAQWLWIYDPRVERWLVWPGPLSSAVRWECIGCLENAATWITGGSKPGTYLWVRAWPGPDANGANVAYRLFIPDAPPGQLNASA